MKSIPILFVFITFLFGCDWIPEDLSAEGTTKIEDLEVMNSDLGNMTWSDAMNEAAELGDGWRLPTKEECSYILHPNEFKLLNLGVHGSEYWTCSEDEENWSMSEDEQRAYCFRFGVGKFSDNFKCFKHRNKSVRAVREIK